MESLLRQLGYYEHVMMGDGGVAAEARRSGSKKKGKSLGRLVSSANTGFTYVLPKPRHSTSIKLCLRKYDPRQKASSLCGEEAQMKAGAPTSLSSSSSRLSSPSCSHTKLNVRGLVHH